MLNYLIRLNEVGFLKINSELEVEKLFGKLKEVQNVLTTEAYIEIEDLISKVVDETRKEFFELGELTSKND